MIRIRLFCVAGMLSTTLVNKMNDAAKLKELEVDIKALPESKLPKSLEGIDAVLLGPQIAYKLPTVKSICESYGIASTVIPMVDFGLMNGSKILDMTIKLIKDNKERLEREAIEREIAEREAAERAKQEAIEREIAEREAEEKAKQEAIEREIAERESAEKARQEAIERETAEREAEEREKQEAMEREIAEREALEEVVSTMLDENKNVNTEDQIKTYNGSSNKEYKAIVKKAKDLILEAEKEVYISTNMDISIFEDEIIEVSQKGVRLTVVSFNETQDEELPIDKLYTHIDEKNKNTEKLITIVIDDSKAMAANYNSNKREDSHVLTDNYLLVAAIYKNILNDIYLLKLRDNIAYKLKDM